MDTKSVTGDYKLGELIIEGKTKQVYDAVGHPDKCILLSKDRITAGDGVKAHDMHGKAVISNKTNGQVFELLNSSGVKTAYIKHISDCAFLAHKCEMVPIEWITRRRASGSFLKRNEGVEEGFCFYPPKQEMCFKDDANHDPQWSIEQVLGANFKVNGLLIGSTEVSIMSKTTLLVFEILERFWATRNCALIDLKIEFGVDENGTILVADVIDSDSWRLWPSGDKRLMVDKQVYRDLATVTAADLDTVKRNFQWVSDQLKHIFEAKQKHQLVVILMGSPSDIAFGEEIANALAAFGIRTQLRTTSAHKTTEHTLRIVQYYESLIDVQVVMVAVAGRSNGLGPVISGNSTIPVINCPPVKDSNATMDVWSSLRTPSGLGCATVLYPHGAALMAAQILAQNNHLIWSKLRAKLLENFIQLSIADQKFSRMDLNK